MKNICLLSILFFGIMSSVSFAKSKEIELSPHNHYNKTITKVACNPPCDPTKFICIICNDR